MDGKFGAQCTNLLCLLQVLKCFDRPMLAKQENSEVIEAVCVLRGQGDGLL